MTKGVMSGKGWPPLRRITSSPPQTLRRRLLWTTDDGRRGECSSMLAAVRRGFVFHSSRLVRSTTLKTCMQRSQIFVQNRVFCLSHLHSTPPLERFRSEYRHPVWYGKTRMVWLPDGEKISRYVYSFWHDPRTWQTDRQTPHDDIGHAYASHRAAKIDMQIIISRASLLKEHS